MQGILHPPTITVQFPSGKVGKVNLLRMLVQTQNAEFKARHGRFLPGVAKQHPTVRALRDEYELPAQVRTWDLAARYMRRFYTDLQRARELALDEARIAAEMEAEAVRGISAPDF